MAWLCYNTPSNYFNSAKKRTKRRQNEEVKEINNVRMALCYVSSKLDCCMHWPIMSHIANAQHSFYLWLYRNPKLMINVLGVHDLIMIMMLIQLQLGEGNFYIDHLNGLLVHYFLWLDYLLVGAGERNVRMMIFLFPTHFLCLSTMHTTLKWPWGEKRCHLLTKKVYYRYCLSYASFQVLSIAWWLFMCG